MDSNHDKELQRLLCYHYTTGQGALRIASRYPVRKEKTAPRSRRTHAPTAKGTRATKGGGVTTDLALLRSLAMPG